MQLLNLALKFYGIVKSLEMIMENIEEKNKDESLGETFKTVIYAIVIAGLIRTFLFEPFKIPSGSMYPTLEIGDFCLFPNILTAIRAILFLSAVPRLRDGCGKICRNAAMWWYSNIRATTRPILSSGL